MRSVWIDCHLLSWLLTLFLNEVLMRLPFVIIPWLLWTKACHTRFPIINIIMIFGSEIHIIVMAKRCNFCFMSYASLLAHYYYTMYDDSRFLNSCIFFLLSWITSVKDGIGREMLKGKANKIWWKIVPLEMLTIQRKIMNDEWFKHFLITIILLWNCQNQPVSESFKRPSMTLISCCQIFYYSILLLLNKYTYIHIMTHLRNIKHEYISSLPLYCIPSLRRIKRIMMPWIELLNYELAMMPRISLNHNSMKKKKRRDGTWNEGKSTTKLGDESFIIQNELTVWYCSHSLLISSNCVIINEALCLCSYTWALCFRLKNDNLLLYERTTKQQELCTRFEIRRDPQIHSANDFFNQNFAI